MKNSTHIEYWKLQNKFYVVRHGRAQNNELRIVSCKMETQAKFGLSQNRKDILKEAQSYRDFDIIYTSPFRRTAETAALFAETSNCTVMSDARLREFDTGNLDLGPSEKFDSMMQEHTDPNYVYENGESLSGALERLTDFIDEINSNHINKKILIVTHGVPAEILLDWANSIPLKKWEKCIEKGKVFSLEV